MSVSCSELNIALSEQKERKCIFKFFGSAHGDQRMKTKCKVLHIFFQWGTYIKPCDSTSFAERRSKNQVYPKNIFGITNISYWPYGEKVFSKCVLWWLLFMLLSMLFFFLSALYLLHDWVRDCLPINIGLWAQTYEHGWPTFNIYDITKSFIITKNKYCIGKLKT